AGIQAWAPSICLDLGGGLDAAVGDDPLQHVDAVLQLLHLGAQAGVFSVVRGRIASHFTHGADRDAELVPDDREGEHQEQDRKDEFEGIHGVLSSTGMRACSRSASIWSAVCAPRSVTICSSTLTRASILSTCAAYCAAFSAVCSASS